MKYILNSLVVVVASILLFASCKKDSYKNDGGVHSPKVNETTYDFLKSHGSFDSLIKVIDLAGLKDMVNSKDATFFAVTDVGVKSYLAVKKQEMVIQTGDENIEFGLQDIDVNILRDSLPMYVFDEIITRESLNIKGEYFRSNVGPVLGDGSKIYIKLRRTRDYSSYLDFVDYINITKVVGTLDEDEPDISAIPEDERDLSYDCQTTGIVTTTGILHVISNQHRLFFNDQK